VATTRIDIDRILCPVDFSDFSPPALDRAVRLAEWFDARIEVLHVIPYLPFEMPVGVAPSYLSDPFEVTAKQRQQAAQSIVDLVAPFLDETVPILTKVLEGEPWRVILEEAKAVPADLLVIGTHGRSGFEHLLLGSVTERVLRRASCPVLAVGRSAPATRKGPLFRRILCATDLTETSPQTLDTALSLASENEAKITLLHVMDALPGDRGTGSPLGISEIGSLRHELAVEARTQLRKAVPDSVRIFCDVTERVETGRPWSEIIRVAEQTDAELIVMGAHATGAVGQMLFGSTASHVVRRATCPVLIIQEKRKPQAAAEREGILKVHLATSEIAKPRIVEDDLVRKTESTMKEAQQKLSHTVHS
jgi:nucleotide-binding universal stress UspA family protein